MKFTFVVLYFDRLEHLVATARNVASLEGRDIELIVVDNHSKIDASETIGSIHRQSRYLRLDDNYGAVARNHGLKMASGDLVVCLDDDVAGVAGGDLDRLQELFGDEKVAAVCFKVTEPESGRVCNWSHHYPKESFSDRQFLTNEISEGAVCFRKRALDRVGLYFDKFFISHEGPDLACRLMDSGFDVVYSPDITVIHHHSDIGRASWRRYYFDTRNTPWLCARNYPWSTAVQKTLWGILPMLVYSLRDGFAGYWFKGVLDSLLGLPEVLKGRKVISAATLARIRTIEANRPAWPVLIRERLAQKRVKI